jgi:UDP-N-acetylglucosamine 1-carboxyvinyltransferase
VRDIRTMQRLLVDIGAQVDIEAATVRSRRRRFRARSALRAGEDHARLQPGAGAAGGALRTGARVAAGRLRHRRAAHQPAHFRLEQLGARINQAHGYIEAVAPDGLRGATVHFDRITVTGTEDLMMAAVLAKGETVLRNAAREPEVSDLADLLARWAPRIEGAGTSTIRIQGVERLHGAEHTIIPDRIEAGTFLIAGAITGGDVTVTDCNPEHWKRSCRSCNRPGRR